MKPNDLNILIVEDESLLALELANTLTEKGYNVINYVTNTKYAHEAVSEKNVHLIIMDINLGEETDGIELYQELETDAEVIYLTSYIDEQTIAKAVKSEPLGYLVKPYKEAELFAFMQLAQLRVNSKEDLLGTLELSYGYSFDMKNEKLFKDKKFVKLGKKSLQLLKMLINAKGNAVSFEEIERELYPENPPSPSSIRTLIYRLRSSLEADMIENELNYGVKLIV